jgi:hypothetical protein
VFVGDLTYVRVSGRWATPAWLIASPWATVPPGAKDAGLVKATFATADANVSGIGAFLERQGRLKISGKVTGGLLGLSRLASLSAKDDP